MLSDGLRLDVAAPNQAGRLPMVGLFGGHRQLSMDSCYGAVRMLLVEGAFVGGAEGQGRVAILRPVFSDGLLGFTKRHLPCFDQGCEIAFDLVLLFEVDLQSLCFDGAALGPDIVQRVGAAEFQGHQMVQFTSGRVWLHA